MAIKNKIKLNASTVEKEKERHKKWMARTPEKMAECITCLISQQLMHETTMQAAAKTINRRR